MRCTRSKHTVPDHVAFCAYCGLQLSPAVRSQRGTAGRSKSTAHSLPTALADYASFGQRVIAFVIDWLIIYAVGIPLSGLTMLLCTALEEYSSWGQLIYSTGTLAELALFVWYFAGLTSRSGRTFGKKMLHIKVVTRSRALPSLGRALLRLIGYVFIGFTGVGFIWALWDSERRSCMTRWLAPS